MDRIKPYHIYDSLTFVNAQKRDEPLWTLQGPLSGELIAGIIIGMYILYARLPDFYSVIILRGNISIYFQLIGIVDINQLMYYFHQSDLTETEFLTNNIVLRPGKYGLWIIDEHFFGLHSFSTPEFIQGFISICNASQVDFRDYIAGPPFQSVSDP